jgi:tight adherence protein C
MVLIVSLASLFLSIAAFAWALMPDVSRRLLRQRIYSEIADTRPSGLDSLIALLEPVHRRLPMTRYSEWVRRLTDGAGRRLPPVHFLIMQEFGALTGVILYVVIMGVSKVNLVGLAVCGLLGAVVPIVWLNNQIHARRMTFTRDLPEVVDLLTLCVGAGSDFMNALNRVVREFRPCPSREELGIVISEVRVGKRRQDALRAFAKRLRTPEALTFSRTLVQADRMGTGLTEALTVVSEDMRLRRYHWAERFAQQAPLKMMVPLLMSLGAAMIIVAGPILVQFLRGGLTSSVSGERPGAGEVAINP